MANAAKQGFKPFARLGYAARGVIYAVIGFFAALAALGAGRPMDSRQALGEVLSGGAGSVLAYVLIVSLVCYSLWRLAQAWLDTDNHGTGFKGLAVRAGLFVSAAVYLTLAAYAWSLRGGASNGSEGGGFAETLSGFVGGRLTAALIAAALAAVGIAHVVKALREKYAKYIEANPHAMRYIHPVAKTGLIARGSVFLTVAFLFALRAWRAESSGGAPGTKDALEYMQSLPAGWLLLGAIGLGLLCFALYSFIEAWYRRIDLENS
jgi:hypothetical protein